MGRIRRILPERGSPGGKVHLEVEDLERSRLDQYQVLFGQTPTRPVTVGETFITAPVPPGAGSTQVTLALDGARSNSVPFEAAARVATNLHPVANPAVDAAGNIYVTLSGMRGQRVPVSIYKVTGEGVIVPLVSDVLNPTGLAVDRENELYVTSRADGCLYKVSRMGTISRLAENLGEATGIALDAEGNLFVGDRRGVIHRVDPSGRVERFADIEPSVAACHLAFDDEQNLFLTSPTFSGYDPVYRIDQRGTVQVFYADLGRPQGLGFDREGNLYVVAHWRGTGGVVRIDRAESASWFATGVNLVGLAFDNRGSLVVVDSTSVYKLSVPMEGRLLS